MASDMIDSRSFHISTWFFKLNGIGWSEPFKYRTIRKSYRPLLFEYWICLVFGSPYKDITYCEDRKNIKYVKISKNCKTWIEARYCSEKLFIISLFKLLHLYWLSTKLVYQRTKTKNAQKLCLKLGYLKSNVTVINCIKNRNV